MSMEPFLKWAGGKRWALTSKEFCYPESYGRYLEPFLGGGAIFFHLRPDQAVLSDINPDLINAYHVIQDQPVELQAILNKYQKKHCKEFYYQTRSYRPRKPLYQAARFIYLNRTCWNGLYRVNLKGEFNVPIGTKTRVVYSEDEFELIATRLAGVELICCDFEETVDLATDGDLLFIDPPYTVKHNLNGFLKYNEKLFSWHDQVRLRNSIVRAAGRGAQVVVTNADHESVRELYSEIAEYVSLNRPSVLAGRAETRGRTTEALFRINC